VDEANLVTKDLKDPHAAIYRGSYDWRGAPVEFSISDAATFMEEQITKVIIGQRPVRRRFAIR
jgi:hypothetical protein